MGSLVGMDGFSRRVIAGKAGCVSGVCCFISLWRWPAVPTALLVPQPFIPRMLD